MSPFVSVMIMFCVFTEPSPVEPSSQDVRAPSPEEIEAKKLEIERLRQVR